MIDSEQNEDSAEFLVTGRSSRILSSRPSNWNHIIIERYRVEPGEKPASDLSHHIIALASGSDVSYGERLDRSGNYVPYSKPPGALYAFLEDSSPALYTRTETDLTVCAIDRGFVSRAMEETPGARAVALKHRFGFFDESTASLIRLLETEVTTGGLYGRLYVDHLLHALVSRLFRIKGQEDRKGSANSLPLPRLRHVVERMRKDLSTDLDLKSLAAESGYSENHFLRMFRVATGLTPHQYLIRLRVMKAQALMRDGSSRLVDIALACGFSSHAHFSRIFRQVLGAAPSEYRRSVL
jgi:AraC family transcriptional regulator